MQSLLQAVALLLEANADVNQAGNDGVAPLHLAAAEGDSRIALLLLRYGAAVNQVLPGIRIRCWD